MAGQPHDVVRLTIDHATPRRVDELPERVRRAAVTGLYVHVPFCFHKCHYCDFYSFVDGRGRQPVFVDAVVAELEARSAAWTAPLESIFIGGGTPTLLEPALLRRLLDALRRHVPGHADLELSVEANPETVTPEIAAILVEGGVNRVSIGAQTFDPRLLDALERWHDPANVERSVTLLRSAGVSSVSLDLIFAVPGSSLASWDRDLDAALALGPDHLSCYGLMFEAGTPLRHKLERGAVRRVPEELEAAQYERTLDRLDGGGFEQYEISNWARRDPEERHRCRHNLAYWRNENWWALGPSGSAHVDGWRWKNAPHLGSFLDHAPNPEIVDVEHLDAEGRAGERLMLGFRLLEGVEDSLLERILVDGDRGPERRRTIDAALEDGLLERRDGRVGLTRRGLLLADSVLSELI